jgi:arsenite-transporting ATPase
MAVQVNFFIGKGGVGKSTTSAITALEAARAGSDTLLVSMDPAHNQRDIFERDFSERPAQVAPRLAVKEVDTDYWIAKYLKETRDHIKRTYAYQSAFNLQKYFKVLQFSPGLEEYALLLAFENILQASHGKDVIIFDMAPTALTLRFFSLPFITLIWLEELLNLRKQIYKKKEIISRIKVGKKEIEQDKVKVKLEGMILNYGLLRDRFRSRATRLHLVMNTDKLSFSEALRIKSKLAAIGVPIHSVVVNKSLDNTIPTEVAREFNAQKISLFPMWPGKLLGYETLENYIASQRDVFADLPGPCTREDNPISCMNRFNS